MLNGAGHQMWEQTTPTTCAPCLSPEAQRAPRERVLCAMFCKSPRRCSRVAVAFSHRRRVEPAAPARGRRGVCTYTQTEGAFTQPNARVCEQMLGWARRVV